MNFIHDPIVSPHEKLLNRCSFSVQIFKWKVGIFPCLGICDESIMEWEGKCSLRLAGIRRSFLIPLWKFIYLQPMSQRISWSEIRCGAVSVSIKHSHEQSLQDTKQIVLTLDHWFTHITDHQHHLISDVSPSPDSFMVRIIGLDKWMVRHALMFKIPFIFGSYRAG